MKELENDSPPEKLLKMVHLSYPDDEILLDMCKNVAIENAALKMEIDCLKSKNHGMTQERESVHAENSKLDSEKKMEAISDYDVTIKVGNEFFRSQRSVLSAESEYFSAMFERNFKESQTSCDEPIILHDMDAEVFRFIFDFIHKRTSEISVTESNIDALLNLSVFLGIRQISSVEEKCVEYLQNYIWKRNPMPKALEVLAFASMNNRKVLINLLSAHIHRHLHHFSKQNKFMQISSNDLNILLEYRRLSGSNEDMILSAVFRWFCCSSKMRIEYFDKIMKNLDLNKVSNQYLSASLKELMEHVHVPINRINESNDEGAEDDKITIFNASVDSNITNCAVMNPSAIHSYVKYDQKSKVQVYSRSVTSSWFLSGEFNSTATIMRTTVLGNSILGNTLYCLSYNGISQSFSASDSTLTLMESPLTNPPLLLNDFEMCGRGNDIYILSNGSTSPMRTQNGDGFNNEELSRSLFHYNCEVDKWFPVPSIEEKGEGRCWMSMDEKLLYVIDGRFNGFTYDCRIAKWNRLPVNHAANPFYFIFLNICLHRGKMYCAFKSDKRKMAIHAHNAIANEWSPIVEEYCDNFCYSPFSRLLSFDNKLWLIYSHQFYRRTKINNFGECTTKCDDDYYKGSWESLSDTIEEKGTLYFDDNDDGDQVDVYKIEDTVVF